MTHEELMNRIDYMSNIIFPAIAERTKAYTDIQKGIADKKHRVIDYPEGSYVMVRVRDRYNNLSPAYQGPYSVVRKTTGGSYVLKDEEEIVPEDELYVIEAIIDHRGEPGNREYLVRWKNYTKEDDSWIPSENFTDPEVLNQYWRRLGVKPSKEQLQKEREKYSPPKNYKKTKLLKEIQVMDDVDVIVKSTKELKTYQSKQLPLSDKQIKRQRHENSNMRRSKRNKLNN
ncbi:hypothetical protein RMCBS344292_17579 [Rhizopus microsporus]|nr:hypothetical protein RMCBS344292_17579 [Rhizopus microsporus]